MQKVLFTSCVAAALAAVAFSGPAYAYTGQKYAGAAKISMAQAARIALKAQPGTITDRELEREPGGSGLRYSFDIEAAKRAHEVGVDAKTGKVLENSVEGPNAD